MIFFSDISSKQFVPEKFKYLPQLNALFISWEDTGVGKYCMCTSFVTRASPEGAFGSGFTAALPEAVRAGLQLLSATGCG